LWRVRKEGNGILFDPLQPLKLPEADDELEGSVVETETSLDLLQAIYRNPYEPIHRRMRAAIAALPFEHPKLAVVARVDRGGIGDRLEVAIRRTQRAQPGPLIEGEALDQSQAVEKLISAVVRFRSGLRSIPLCSRFAVSQ
jgi:hypothetical protein